jgi:CheY-like chemotaxis protein
LLLLVAEAMEIALAITLSDESSWPPHARVRVLIAHADADVRRLIKGHLGRAVRVVGEARDGKEAIELARSLLPDVVVLDMALPLMAGPEAAGRIKAERSETRVVLLTSDGDGAREGVGTAGTRPVFLNADALLPKDAVMRSRKAYR